MVVAVGFRKLELLIKNVRVGEWKTLIDGLRITDHNQEVGGTSRDATGLHVMHVPSVGVAG